MAFPTTGILDTFDRPNEGPPPSANWTDSIIGLGVNGLRVVANQCEPSVLDANRNESYWSAAQFGPDCEVYGCFVSCIENAMLFARLQNPGGGGADGYGLYVDSDDDLYQLWRFDNTAAVLLATFPLLAADGDWFGLELVSSTISFYHRPAAGSWTFVGSHDDATYILPGFLGAGLTFDNFNTDTLDNFGGGNHIPEAVPKRVLGGLTMGAGAGKTYDTPDGTVYLKKAGTFDPFVWGGRCMRVDGDISETLRAMTVTTRQNPLGGIERDGILLGPPAETTLTLVMKRKQAERKKTELKKCLWTIDERIHCKDPQAWNAWEEITRACTCRANTRTLSGTSWGDSEEMLVGLPQTCFQVVDIYRITGEEVTT